MSIDMSIDMPIDMSTNQKSPAPVSIFFLFYIKYYICLLSLHSFKT